MNKTKIGIFLSLMLVLGFCSSCKEQKLSLIHISEPTRLGMISYAVFCLKKKKQDNTNRLVNADEET